jgi:hypothetical protein
MECDTVRLTQLGQKECLDMEAEVEFESLKRRPCAKTKGLSLDSAALSRIDPYSVQGVSVNNYCDSHTSSNEVIARQSSGIVRRQSNRFSFNPCQVAIGIS